MQRQLEQCGAGDRSPQARWSGASRKRVTIVARMLQGRHGRYYQTRCPAGQILGGELEKCPQAEVAGRHAPKALGATVGPAGQARRSAQCYFSVRAEARSESGSSFHASAAVGQASTHAAAERTSASRSAPSSGTATRMSNPRPTNASPSGSPASRAISIHSPQSMHLPGSKMSCS